MSCMPSRSQGEAIRERSRAALVRTEKSCGSGAPTLALRFETVSRGAQPGVEAQGQRADGGKTARSPGRARRKLLRPLRGECRAIPVPPAVNTGVHTSLPQRTPADALSP